MSKAFHDPVIGASSRPMTAQVRSLFWGEAEAKRFLEQQGAQAQMLLVASTWGKQQAGTLVLANKFQESLSHQQASTV